MKIDRNLMAGATPLPGDEYRLLVRGLVAVQAVTPTAQASVAPVALTGDEAMSRLFGRGPDRDVAAALHSSFSPAIAQIRADETG